MASGPLSFFMASNDLSDINSAQSVKLVGADSSGVEGTPVGSDVSGNLKTVNNNGSGASAVNIQDGGNSITVDSAQLPASLGQKTMSASLPVVISSDQSSFPISTPDTTSSGTLGALNATVSIALSGQRGAGFQLAAGTLIGTLIPEVSFDGGTSWIATAFDNPTTGLVSATYTFSSSNTLTGLSVLGVGGSSNARVRVSAYTSGTANAAMRASQVHDTSPGFQGVDSSTVPPSIAVIGGIDRATGFAQTLKVDSIGNITVSPLSQVPVWKARFTQTILSNASYWLDYTVPVKSGIKQLLAGGTGSGTSGGGRVSLYQHDSTAISVVTNGNFASSGEVTPWAAVTGTFTAPTPDFSTVQQFNGTGSMRWTYASSGTVLERKQTLSPAQDYSGHRYISAYFYNDATTAVTRTLSIKLTSGVSTQTYSVALVAGTTLPSNAWYQMLFDLNAPTTVTGTSFDITQVSGISLMMQDSGNKAGTVYWDYVTKRDSLVLLYRLYFSGNDTKSIAIDPVETFVANDQIYLTILNTGSNSQEFSAQIGAVTVP